MRGRWPTLRWRILGALALTFVALAGGVAAADANPPANIPPQPDFDATCVVENGVVVQGYCSWNPLTGQWSWDTPQREQAALAAIDNARAQEGLGPLVLPVTWPSLTPAEQQFVLVDLERVARGLPPLVGLARGLDTIAAQGASQNTDPVVTAPWNGYASGSNWAGEGEVAPALYAYMYEDGWGGSPQATLNLDCTGPQASGCWGHRDNILGDWGTTGLMGAANLPGSSAQVFVAYDGPPVPLTYTWTQALEAGAGGLPVPAGPELPFSDLGSVPWASIPVVAMAQLGVIQGTGPGVFQPDGLLSEEQWVTLLGRMLGWSGQPAEVPLPAGTAPWAEPFMAYAAAAGWLPNGLSAAAPLDRAQATAILTAALHLPAATQPAPFTDLGGLPAAEQQAIAAAWSAGLVAGVGQDLFAPGQVLTRAQAATLLLRAALYAVRVEGADSLAGQTAGLQALPEGLWLYRLGGQRLLLAADGTPLLLYSGPAWGPDWALVFAQGQWWVGQAVWQSPSSGWPQGAVRYGSASLQLWPLQSPVGPALFAPTVGLAVFGDGEAQGLLPGASQWQPLSPGLVADVTLTADLAVR